MSIPTRHYVKRGFTLIELLIVVAIISILISIGATSYLRAQKNGRDGQRKSDLGIVASGLEQYYADNNKYPQSGTGADAGKIFCDGAALNWDGTTAFACSSRTYLSKLPQDLLAPAQNYYYLALNSSGAAGCDNTSPGNSCQRFILSTNLENNNDDSRNAGCNSSNATDDYCLYP